MRQLIIFVAYINVEAQPETRVGQQLSDMSAWLNQLITEKEQLMENINIKWIVLPVKNQETKIECIYPVKSNIIGDEILEKLGLLEEKTKKIKI